MSTKCCNNCKNGISLAINSDILCRFKGIVSYDFCCSRYSKDSVLKSSHIINKCIDCSFFIPKENDSGDIGLCQLFSVRHFEGRTKRACSKYSKKTRLEVS